MNGSLTVGVAMAGLSLCSSRSRLLTLAGALAVLVSTASAAQVGARTNRTDPRWLAWLGCWGGAGSADTTRAAGGLAGNATCVVPIAGSPAVEALTIARGKIVTRDRLDASLASHRVNGQGCDGSETVNWSGTGHRVFLRADYVCAGGTKGVSSTVFSFSSDGDWVYVQAVRSGGGTVSTIDRRHPVELLAAVPAEAARVINDQQLAITTARAAAAAPITSTEIIDAVHDLDATAVRTWVAASGQTFDVSGNELSALARADVPQSVLQAIMASTSRAGTLTGAAGDSAHDVDAYLSRPGFNPAYGAAGVPQAQPYYPMSTMYVCPPTGCFPSASSYSSYNGVTIPNSYYPYPGYVPYPLVYPGGFINVHTGRGGGRGESHEGPRPPAHEPPRGHGPKLPGPVGKRP